MKVPPLDLQAQYVPNREDVLAAATRVCDTRQFIIGRVHLFGLCADVNPLMAAAAGAGEDAAQAIGVTFKGRTAVTVGADAARRRTLFQRVGLPARVRRPEDPAGRTQIRHRGVTRVPNRDAVRAHLAARHAGIDACYPVPFHRQGDTAAEALA